MRDGDGQAGARARRHGARFGHASEATRAGLPLLVCVVGRHPSPPSPALYNHHPTPPPSPHCHHGEHAFLAPVLLWSHPPRLLPPSSWYMRSIYLDRLLIPLHPAHDAPLPTIPCSLFRHFLHRSILVLPITVSSFPPVLPPFSRHPCYFLSQGAPVLSSASFVTVVFSSCPQPLSFFRQFLHHFLVIRAMFCHSVHPPPRISPVTPSPHFLRPEFRRSQ